MPEAIQETTIDQAFIESKYSQEEIMQTGTNVLPRCREAKATIDAWKLDTVETSFQGLLDDFQSVLEEALAEITDLDGDPATLATPVEFVDLDFDGKAKALVIKANFKIKHSIEDIHAAGISHLMKIEQKNLDNELELKRFEAIEQKARENQERMDQDKMAELIRRYPDKARELLGS